MEHWIKLYLSHDNQLTGSSIEDQGGHIREARIDVTNGVDVLYDLWDGNVIRVLSVNPNDENYAMLVHNTITTPIGASRGLTKVPLVEDTYLLFKSGTRLTLSSCPSP
jgi:hypothetical protein